MQFLPKNELTQIFLSTNRNKVIIGGFVNKKAETISLWRGDLSWLVVPFSAFHPSGSLKTITFCFLILITSL